MSFQAVFCVPALHARVRTHADRLLQEHCSAASVHLQDLQQGAAVGGGQEEVAQVSGPGGGGGKWLWSP